jgi:hypothetical protein
LGYIDQYDLAQDLSFRKKISVAMATAGVAVAGESQGVMSPVKYSKRQALAKAVLNSPTVWLEQFALAVVQNAAVTTLAPVNISSSTNAYPIVVTTAAAHGLSTGDTVRIEAHLVNTAANGTWTATNLTSTTFSIPVAGVGIGAATGRTTELPSDSDIQFTVNSVWDDMAGVTGLD